MRSRPEIAPGRPERGRAFWRELGVGLGVAVLLFVVYIHSPASGLWDAKYALLTSEALLQGEGFDLSRFLPGLAERASSEEAARGPFPWQLEQRRSKLIYVFPPGTPVLSVPCVAALRAAHLSTLDAEGLYDERNEQWLQLLVASFLAAATVFVIFRLARHEVPLLPSAAIALLTGLGTSLWTVASRQLWSHSWSALLIGLGWLELLRWEEGAKPRPWILGAIASAAFWVRPSSAFVVVAWTVYVALRHRAELLRVVAAGAAGLSVYLLWSLHATGSFLPRYVTMRRPWDLAALPLRLAESLVSSHHGLLVYSPLLFWVAWVLLRRGVPPERRSLAGLAVVLAIGHLLLCAASSAEWGAEGPRFQHDVMPLLAWLAALAVRRSREIAASAGNGRWRWATTLALVVLGAASILASIGSLWVGQRAMGLHRARLESESSEWDWHRLPQVHGLRVVTDTSPPALVRRKARRDR